LLAVDPVLGKTLEQVNKKATKEIEKNLEQEDEKMQVFFI